MLPRPQSVRSKLLLSSMLPAAVGLLLAAVVTGAFVQTRFQTQLIASLSVVTEIIAENGSASLAVDDSGDAASVLATLASAPSVIVAALYRENGTLLAGYPDSATPPRTLPADGSADGEGGTIVRAAVVDGVTIGFAYVRSDLRELTALKRGVRLAELGAALLALVVAFVLATGLHRTILGPVQALSLTARRITERREFSARVPIGGDDELGWLGLAFNEMVDEIERNDARLREREAYFRSLIENSTDLTTVVGVDGVILYQSPAVQGVLGRSPESLDGRLLTDLMHPDDRAEAEATLAEAFAAPGTVKAFIWRGSHASGSWRYLDAVARVHQGQDGTRVAIINARDVTVRRTIESQQEVLAAQLQQSQKMEVVGQLTGGVAHDFNNLLTVILGNLELAAEDLTLPDDVRPLLFAAQTSAERGATLTRRLLAFSRKQALQPQTVNLDELMGGMEDLLRRTLGETYRIDFSGEADLWSCVVDPAQLENAVLNLAINARDAMPRGGRLSITCANCENCPHVEGATGDFVTLTVADTGTGIPEEILAKVFDPFFTTKAVGHGSGLGLSMVYGFVMQSGGGVQIHSGADTGTSVVIHLPRGAGIESSQADNDMPRSQVPGHGETILVVEDDLQVQSLSLKLLKHMGYNTLAASDGNSALRLIQDEARIDLLFTDIALPGGMSGLELADRARYHSPGLRVLYTSGYTEKALGGIRMPGNSALLRKPFSRVELSLRIEEVIHQESGP